MKKNLIYSFVVFFILFAYFIAGLLTTFKIGGVKSEDLSFTIIFMTIFSSIVSFLFFLILKKYRKNSRGSQELVGYKPSITFVFVALILVAISIIFGILMARTNATDKAQLLALEAQVAKSTKQAAELEEKRLATMTPKERADVSHKDLAAKALLHADAVKSSVKWISLSTSMWTGVKVYTGNNKIYGFEVLGGSNNCKMLDGSGVMVRYNNDVTEWKSRKALRNEDVYFVREDDLALQKHEWYEIKGC